jgi:DNA-binding XRE family transcriptional regulator
MFVWIRRTILHTKGFVMAISLSLMDALKQVRKKLDITQDVVASDAGCSRSTIANIERGQICSPNTLKRIAGQFNEADKATLLGTPEALRILGTEANGQYKPSMDDESDMIQTFMNLRRSGDVDLSGTWNAIWLTTVNGEENRNKEVVIVSRRWNGTWQFANQAISSDNPKGGYLWVARMELFDNTHLLGHYCARERNIRAKGTLCLELQSNGREIIGVWDGLNFDTMWATGFVALTDVNSDDDPSDTLERFIRTRPKMPY